MTPPSSLLSWERFWQVALTLACCLFAVVFVAFAITALWQTPMRPAENASAPLYAAYSYGSLPPVSPDRAKMALLDMVKMVGGIGWFATLLYSLRRFAGFGRSR